MTNPKKDIFMLWKLKTYVDDDGDRILAEWYSTLSDAEKAKFQVRVWYLLPLPRDEWTRPQFDTLNDDAAGFGEIRMGKVANRATRLIGYFSGDAFNIVVVVTKKGHKYDPSNWVKLARDRKLEMENDTRRASEWIPQKPMEQP